jgi:NADH:ubiquinone oxidoreductase subunit H
LCVGSLNLTAIVEAQNTSWGLIGWYWLRLLPMFVIFFVSALAETNRPPFDLVLSPSIALSTSVRATRRSFLTFSPVFSLTS